MEKQAQTSKETEEKLSITEQIRARPISKLSKQHFITENVAVVKGTLKRFNSELFPELPIKKGAGEDGITGEISLFINRTGKNTAQELLRFPRHGRNLYLNIKFTDREGKIYNYIDIKGGGLPERGPHAHAETVEKKIVEGKRQTMVYVSGMGDWEEATKDWKLSEFFRKKGVEVAPPIAIIEISEFILADGTRMSVKEAMKNGMLPRNLEFRGETYKNRPVLYLRAFTEDMRLSDATRDDFRKFAAEHGMKLNEYMDWLGGKMADNLLKIHKSGKVHANLITHNWTLDGHVVDFDTVKQADMKEIMNDITYIVTATISALYIINKSINQDGFTRLQAAFLRKYLADPFVTKDEIGVLYATYDASLKDTVNDNLKFMYKTAAQEIADIYKKRFGKEMDYKRYAGD